MPHSYKSWTSHSSTPSAPSYPTTTPGPMPAAPHLHTVSLPHPNSSPYHASSSAQYHSSLEGPSRILSLNPLLSWTGVPPLYYNVTRDVQYIQLQPGCPPNLVHAPAMQPASTLLVLSLPSLPLWSTIEVRNPRGVSVYDVLMRIRDVLNRSVSQTEMGAMASISTASTSEYFRARTRADPREFAQGVKRIDFLGPNVFFAGLSRSMDGQDRWEVHFAPRA